MCAWSTSSTPGGTRPPTFGASSPVNRQLGMPLLVDLNWIDAETNQQADDLSASTINASAAIPLMTPTKWPRFRRQCPLLSASPQRAGSQ